jgi:hypothetical protein
MTENNDKPKRSFVSEEDANKPQTTESTDVPKADVSLHMMNGKLSDILVELRALNSLFKYAKANILNKVESLSTPIPSAPTQAPSPVPVPVQDASPRMKEIMIALEPVKDLLKFDDNNSTMVLIVRPAHYLGSDNFAKIAAIVRNLGGSYVSAGKNSHFEIPKNSPRKA